MRAKIVLSLAAGKSQVQTSRSVGCSVNTVRLWKERFVQELISGLYGRHLGRIRNQQSVQIEAQVLKPGMIAEAVRIARKDGWFPLVLSGNCNAAVGSVCGMAPFPELKDAFFDFQRRGFKLVRWTPEPFLRHPPSHRLL